MTGKSHSGFQVSREQIPPGRSCWVYSQGITVNNSISILNAHLDALLLWNTWLRGLSGWSPHLLRQSYTRASLGPSPSFGVLSWRLVSSAISCHTGIIIVIVVIITTVLIIRSYFYSLTGEKTKLVFSMTFSLLHPFSFPFDFWVWDSDLGQFVVFRIGNYSVELRCQL